MKKDIDKLLSKTITIYLTILFVVFILKLFGLNYFNLDTNNRIIVMINNFILYFHLQNLWYCFTLYLDTFIILSITCNDNSKKMKFFAIITTLIGIILKVCKSIFSGLSIFVLIDFLYLFILSLIYIIFVKKEKILKHNITNYLTMCFLTIVFQLVSIITRNIELQSLDNFIISNILSLDYLVLSIFSYKLYFIKGGKSLCGMVLGFSSDLLISLKDLPKKLQISYQKCKPKKTEDELADKIYLILFWLYNLFTIAVVLLIAFLNDTFIECIFILSSFWMSKGAFGKPFHLKKASTCFIVSSSSYYLLNRLTWNIGISFLVPVVLGIALSYITSKYMDRHDNVYLYRGMSLDAFYDLITRVTSNKDHIEICKRYYVDKESNVKIAIAFNYSEINIKKIKQKINKQIKELQ